MSGRGVNARVFSGPVRLVTYMARMFRRTSELSEIFPALRAWLAYALAREVELFALELGEDVEELVEEADELLRQLVLVLRCKGMSVCGCGRSRPRGEVRTVMLGVPWEKPVPTGCSTKRMLERFVQLHWLTVGFAWPNDHENGCEYAQKIRFERGKTKEKKKKAYTVLLEEAFEGGAAGPAVGPEDEVVEAALRARGEEPEEELARLGGVRADGQEAGPRGADVKVDLRDRRAVDVKFLSVVQTAVSLPRSER
jgi:hypothetical protein